MSPTGQSDCTHKVDSYCSGFPLANKTFTCCGFDGLWFVIVALPGLFSYPFLVDKKQNMVANIVLKR